jgi:hypothetical protein
MHGFSCLGVGLCLVLPFSACAERRTNSESSPIQLAPAASVSGAAAAPAQSSAPSASASGAVSSTPAPVPSASASASASAAPSSGIAEPSLLDADGKALPQTEDRPRVDSPAFQRRVEQLVDAIVHDEPSRASAAFFPVVAYEQVKAVAKPERDWKFRLMRAFEKNIREYHRALGPNPEQARFVGIEVPEASARWMKPGSEGNRLGYFRVLRSRLRMTQADGKERAFEVTSMISWRGEWYVVHLNGFE